MLFIVGGARQCGGERTVPLLVRSGFRSPAIPSDLGPGVAGLHDDHADAERPYFQAQTFGHALQRELGRAVQRLVRERDQAPDGAHVYDVPTTLATQWGPHGPARQEPSSGLHYGGPWRAPRAPPLPKRNQLRSRSKPTGASAAGGGVRPTIYADVPRCTWSGTSLTWIVFDMSSAYKHLRAPTHSPCNPSML